MLCKKSYALLGTLGITLYHMHALANPHESTISSHHMNSHGILIHRSSQRLQLPMHKTIPFLYPSATTQSLPISHSFTTLNCPLPPLFLSMPFGLIPPCALLASLNRPCSISCLPELVIRLCAAIRSGGAPVCLSRPELNVPRRVSPTPCKANVRY